MSAVSNKWMKFFKDAGLPQSVATSYAIIFTSHRIQNDMLTDLTKEILYDMGIKTMGDVIAILRHAKSVDHETTAEKLLGTSVNEVSSCSTASRFHVSSSKRISQQPSQPHVLPKLSANKPTVNAPQLQSSKIISLKRAANDNVVQTKPKIRRITADNDDEYDDEDSDKFYVKNNSNVLKSENLSKTSVFSRLGADNNKVKESLSSIFSRLGTNNNNNVTNSTSTPKRIVTISDNRITTSRSNVVSTRPAINKTVVNTPVGRRILLQTKASALRSQQTDTLSVKERIRIDSPNGLQTSNRMIVKRNVKASQLQVIKKTSTISPAVAQAKKAAIRRAAVVSNKRKTISLRKNIFDRLGPMSL